MVKRSFTLISNMEEQVIDAMRVTVQFFEAHPELKEIRAEFHGVRFIASSKLLSDDMRKYLKRIEQKTRSLVPTCPLTRNDRPRARYNAAHERS
jgi:hypothetical protein